MKKIICLILIFSFMLSFSSCNNAKRERREIALEVIKEFAIFSEVNSIHRKIKKIKKISCFYNENMVLAGMSIDYVNTDGKKAGCCIGFLDGLAETDADKTLAECGVKYNTLLFVSGLFRDNPKFKTEKKISGLDLRWINSELQDFQSNQAERITCIKNIHDRLNAWVDCMQKNDMFSGYEYGLPAFSNVVLIGIADTAEFLWCLRASLSEDERAALGAEDPWYKYMAMNACKGARNDLEEKVKNPSSLQINEQKVNIYKLEDRYYCEVVTDYSAQNGFGGFVRDAVYHYGNNQEPFDPSTIFYYTCSVAEHDEYIQEYKQAISKAEKIYTFVTKE